jgi:tripartite-type tricarboxylate transporter receptor subunit TctC
MPRTLIALACLVALTAPAQAQDWPTRPVTLVVPYAAGGGADIAARILAPRMSELLGQQVVVENVGGAGGMNGANRIAKAAPDGYQFVIGTMDTHGVNQSFYKNPAYNAATDFTPVVLLAELPLLLITRNDFPANNLQEFLAHAKANHARMQYGSAGIGTGTHLACVMLDAAIGARVTHVPYRGVALALPDLIAGRLDYQCPVAAALMSHLEGKTVKPLAILTRNRSAILPDLASAHEQGLTDFDASAWFAFFLPPKTPEPIARKLRDVSIAALTSPGMPERFRKIAADIAAPERRTPEYLQAYVESEIKKWAAPVKASGASAE